MIIKASALSVGLQVRDPIHFENAVVTSIEPGPGEGTVEVGLAQEDGDELSLVLEEDQGLAVPESGVL